MREFFEREKRDTVEEFELVTIYDFLYTNNYYRICCAVLRCVVLCYWML